MTDVEFIFGGSFDPVHNGHLHILKNLLALECQWPIRILPCSVPALKQQSSASLQHRIKMIELAVVDNPRIIIDAREGERVGKSYTYETLVELRKEFPARRLILVMGSDNLESIEQWFNAPQLSHYCHLLVVNRPESNVDGLVENLNDIGFSVTRELSQLQAEENGLVYYLKISEKDISSTKIRKQLVSMSEKTNELGGSSSEISSTNQDIDLSTITIDTPLVVKQYIKQHSIYM